MDDRDERVETRGIVIVPDLEASRAEIIEEIERITDSGFNLLILNLLPDGEIILPLPSQSKLFGKQAQIDHDRLREALAFYIEGAALHGLSACLGVHLSHYFIQDESRFHLTNLQRLWFFPKGWPTEDSDPERFDGEERWLIPNLAESRRFITDYLVHLLSAFPFQSIWLGQIDIPKLKDNKQLENFKFFQYLKAARLGTPSPDENQSERHDIKYWNRYWEKETIAFLNYLRQRIFKARPQITVIGSFKVDQSHTVEEEDVKLDGVFDITTNEPPAEDQNKGEAELQHTANIAELDWHRDKEDSPHLAELREQNPFGFIVKPHIGWGLVDAETISDLLRSTALLAHEDIPANTQKTLDILSNELGEDAQAPLSHMQSALATSGDSALELSLFLEKQWPDIAVKLNDHISKTANPESQAFLHSQVVLFEQLISLHSNRLQMIQATPYFA